MSSLILAFKAAVKTSGSLGNCRPGWRVTFWPMQPVFIVHPQCHEVESHSLGPQRASGLDTPIMHDLWQEIPRFKCCNNEAKVIGAWSILGWISQGAVVILYENRAFGPLSPCQPPNTHFTLIPFYSPMISFNPSSNLPLSYMVNMVNGNSWSMVSLFSRVQREVQWNACSACYSINLTIPASSGCGRKQSMWRHPTMSHKGCANSNPDWAQIARVVITLMHHSAIHTLVHFHLPVSLLKTSQW